MILPLLLNAQKVVHPHVIVSTEYELLRVKWIAHDIAVFFLLGMRNTIKYTNSKSLNYM